MKVNRRLGVGTAATLVALATAATAATATEQVVLAQVGASVSISGAPTASVDLGALPATGAALGTITVSANAPYLLTARVAKPTMTLWNSTTSTYTDSVRLASPFLLTSTASSGLGVGIPATALSDAAPLVIGTGATGLLLATTDAYALTGTQLATATDVAGTYRNVITYTVSSVL